MTDLKTSGKVIHMKVDIEFAPAKEGYRTAKLVGEDGIVIREFVLDDYDNYHDYFTAITKLRDRVEAKNEH